MPKKMQPFYPSNNKSASHSLYGPKYYYNINASDKEYKEREQLRRDEICVNNNNKSCGWGKAARPGKFRAGKKFVLFPR